MDGESDFIAAMIAAIVFAAFMGWPSCTVAGCPAVLCYAALSEVVGRFWVPAAMLVWAALSGYGGYACCDAEYSLEFLFRAATLIAPLAVENTWLFILFEMMQVVSCVENRVPGSSSQKDDSDLFEWVEVERAMNLNLRVRWLTTPSLCLTLWVRRAGGVGASMSLCSTFLSMECRRGSTAWKRT